MNARSTIGAPRAALICVLAAFLLGIVHLSSALAGIEGSAHDFSPESWSMGEICLPCHTPHNSDTTVSSAALWNHAVTTSTFEIYSSPTMDVTPGQPGGVSRLCLSCHDGTVALDSFGGNMGSIFVSGDADLTTDLSDDHPVGMLWDHSTVTPPARPDTCSICHNVSVPGVVISELSFPEGMVECSTCHDPHNGANEEHLLRITNANSELCLHCHANK